MGNRFGINSSTGTGDGSTLNTANAAENTENPKPTGLNFNSVISNSFNSALTDANSLLKDQQAQPKPDNSTLLSASGNVVTGLVGGIWDQGASLFKKDKATLAREADLGGVSALSSGHSISSSFVKTATDVATAVPALNPFSADGRKNLGTLSDKWVQGWTTGTLDEKAHFLGTNLSFVATIAGGSVLAGKGSVGAVNDLRGGTMATRAATATEVIGNDLRTVASVSENAGIASTHIFSPAIEGVSLTTKVSQGFSRLTEAVGITGRRAETLSLATESALNTERSFASRLSPYFANVKPASVTSAAFTDAGKVVAADATRDFTTALEKIAPTATTETALKELRDATRALASGTPEAQANFIKTLESAGAHIPELQAPGRALVRTVENSALNVTVDSAAKNIGTKLETLTSTVAKGSPEAKALQNIQNLAADVARGGNKSDELIQALKALKQDAPNLNPQLVDGLVADVSKLEGATAGRRLLTSFEGHVDDLNKAVNQMQATLTKEASNVRTGSPELEALNNVKTAANDLAHGLISPEQFGRTVEDLRRYPNISAETVKAVSQDAAQVVEKANVTNLFTHMDDLIKPVREAASGLDKTIGALEKVPAQDVTRVQQALADFVAGRSGNAEDLTAAVRKLTTNNNMDAAVAENINKQLGALVKEVESARPALVMERSISESAPILEQAAKKFAGTPQAKAVEEVQQAFSGAIKGNVTADELAQVVSRNSKVLERVAPGATETLTVNGTKIADAAVDSTRALAIENGLKDIQRIPNDLAKVAKEMQGQFAGDAQKLQALRDVEEAAVGFQKGTKTIEELRAATNAAAKAEIPINFSKSVDDLALASERVPRLQALEESLAKTRQAASGFTATTDLMEAAVRQGQQFQAIDKLRAAVKSGNAEEIAAAVKQSQAGLAQLEKIKPGVTEQILADVAKVSEGGSNRALTRLTNTLDEAELVAKRSSDEFKAIEQIRAAAKRAGSDGLGDDLARALKDNEAKIAKIEKAAKDSQVNAIHDLRAAAETGNAEQIGAAIAKNERGLAELERVQPGITKQLAADAAKIADDGSSVTRIKTALDNAERAAASQVNFGERLSANAGVLDAQAANARRLANIENSSRSLTSTVENLAPKLEDPARLALYKSNKAGEELVNDIRNLAAKTEDAALKERLAAKATELETAGATLNPAKERLNVIKTLSEDLAKTSDATAAAAKERELLNFVQKSSTRLEEVAKGTTATVESKVAAISDAQKLQAAESAVSKVRASANLADEAANLGFKANTPVHDLASEFQTAVRKFAREEGTIADVNAAAKKLYDFKPAAADEHAWQALQRTAQRIETDAVEMQKARAVAFDSQFKSLSEALNSRNLTSYSTALNHIANLYEIATPSVQNRLLALRESILDSQAFRIVQEQGFYGKNTLAQRVFGSTANGGSPFALSVQNGTFNTRPVAGLVSDKGQLLDAIERVNNNIAANQVKFSVRGLMQDRAALLANPALAQEALQRKLLQDVAMAGGGTLLAGTGAMALKKRAEDILYDELNAPYKMADLMEKEIAAKSDSERQQYRDQLAAMVADYIRDKNQAQIDALRAQIQQIVSERTSNNPAAQAVWSRGQKEMSVGQIRAKKEHDNQVQYGNPHGPARGPGDVSVQETAQQIFVAPQNRIRQTSASSIDETANKRKPATTNFDIGKIRDMSNNFGYTQNGLRAMPYGANGPNSLAQYTPGSSKPWQNVVAWKNGGKIGTGAEQGKQAYGNFQQIEKTAENDQAGVGGAAVAQAGPNSNDPTANLQLAAAGQNQQAISQDEQQNAAAV